MIFILGIERSATTWVSNIIDMHPGTELYMEPLSSNVSRFERWPNRFIKIQNVSQKAKYFKEEFNYIKNRKRLLFTRVYDTNWAWHIDMKIGQKMWGNSSIARDFFELNFHRRETTGYPSKNAKPIRVIKELRLNFNAPVIKEINSNTKVVVILRNYAANIQSIAKQIEKGNLVELNQILQNKFGKTNINTIFSFWANSYNVLLKDLENENINYLLIKHKDLITSGKETIKQLFQFIGLPLVPSVYNYLVTSNKKGSGKHNTNRNHADVVEKNRQAEKELYPMLAEHISGVEWHPLLQDFVTKF